MFGFRIVPIQSKCMSVLHRIAAVGLDAFIALKIRMIWNEGESDDRIENTMRFLLEFHFQS